MKENSVLLGLLAPQVEKALSNKHTVSALEKLIGEYLDRNVQKLTTSGPIYRTVFSDDEVNKFFQILSINPDDVRKILKQSTYIRKQWHIMNNPFNSTAAFCIRYFKMKKDLHMMTAMVTYLTLSMYPSLHYKYFKYEPNENVMRAVINQLSNKFKFKTSSTVYAALVDTTKLSDKTYSSILVRATDKDITDYIQAYKTRLNSMIRKLANVFYDVEKKGMYLNTDTENSDADDYKVADNDTLVAERLSDATVMTLTVHGPNMQLITIASQMSDVSVNELRNTINSIVADKENREDLKTLTSAIVYLFIFDAKQPKEKIGTNDFFYYCLDLYKRANTTDKNISTIKRILDKWLSEYSESYKRSSRVATLNNFRRGLFIFMTLSIQQSTK